MIEERAREHAVKVVQALTEEQKTIAIMLLKDLLYDTFLAGAWQERKDGRDRLKELRHDISVDHIGSEEILLRVEDLIAR